MEFHKINATKLKVILSSAECESYDIRVTDGEYDTKEVRDALKEIISEAGRRVDFSVGSERVLIQLYPVGDGGAEMFVTKLSSVGARERETICDAANLTTYQGRESVFRFSDGNTLLSALSATSSCLGLASLYVTDDGAYYLTVDEEMIDGRSGLELLCEYGCRISQFIRRCEEERWRLVCSSVPLGFMR